MKTHPLVAFLMLLAREQTEPQRARVPALETPLHFNCRCWAVPLIDDLGDPET